MATSLTYRRILLAILVSGAAVIAGWSFLARAQDTKVDDLTAQSNPEIQDRIYATLNAFQQANQNNADEAFRQLGLLRSVNPQEIVTQLAIFAARVGDGEQVLRARRILDLLNIQPAIVIEVLAPYVDADESNLRSFVRDWFEYHDKAGAPGPGLPPLQPVNYSDYKDYIRGKIIRNEEVPEPFVEYIYERLPGHALLAFYYAHGPKDRDILFAENNIRNVIWLKSNGFDEEYQKELLKAKAQLLKLATHEEWWVRLYVAEIMRHQAELRDENVMKSLASDSNELVAKAAQKEAAPARQADNRKGAKGYDKWKERIKKRKAAAPKQ
jgi:hypothetical protein